MSQKIFTIAIMDMSDRQINIENTETSVCVDSSTHTMDGVMTIAVM